MARLLGSGGSGGERGYVNWGSGWADAEGALWWLLGEMVGKARERGMVDFIRERARRLVYRDCAGGKRRRVVGVETVDGSEVFADLTVVAAGAWSGALVDLRGRAEARGQVLAYVSISEEEREILKDMPVILNLSTGMFAIPPTADTAKHSGTGGWAVKVARHAYGYANPTRVAPESEEIVTSLPAERFEPIPEEGKLACREFLREVIPWLGEREWSSTRICWYTDTPTGNFLIDYHLEREGLFLATGGSGHGFKFLPVLGDKVVAAIDGSLEDELSVLWRWPEEKLVPFMGTEDGSRTGRRDMVLDQS